MNFLERLGYRSRTSDENACADPRRKVIFHKRGSVSSDRHDRAPSFRWELCVDPGLDFGAKIEVVDEDDLEGSLRLFGCAFYWGVDGIFGRKLRGKLENRELAFSFHDGLLSWRIWKDPHSWSREDGWRNSWWNVKDTIIGRAEHASTLSEERTVQVPLPEKSYPAVVKMTYDTWKRPRWFTQTVKRAHVEIEKGLPMPGKGENSYDCGDDALFGSTFPAESVEEAIGHVVGSVLRTRWRRSKTHNWEDE